MYNKQKSSLYASVIYECLECKTIVHMNYVIEGQGALVNPSEKHQYRNKGDKPFKMICGVPKEFE